VFAPLLPPEGHLSRLACADVYLDAWPCNAHTTAGEALWCGVPVVTIVGATFAQRVAGSLLHAVELDELACADVDAYAAAVTGLAADPSRRAQLRTHCSRNDREPAVRRRAPGPRGRASVPAHVGPRCARPRTRPPGGRGRPLRRDPMKAVILAGGLGSDARYPEAG
jgi:hypothetical protein